MTTMMLLILAGTTLAGDDDGLRLPKTLSLDEPIDELPEEVLVPAEEAEPQEGRRDRNNFFEDNKVIFAIGPAAGYIRARDADRGTWFAGVQARAYFLKVLAIEGSITFHQDEFGDGDVEVTQYPVQVSALLFPFPHSALSPYVLGGAGWYYTRVDFDDDVLGGDDETSRLFGFHAGAGAQLLLGPHVAAFADFRWIFLDEQGIDNSDLEDEDFDSWQVSLGLGIAF